MHISAKLRAAFIGLAALSGLTLSSAANADSGSISFTVLKAGFVVGGSAGSGVLTFHGRSYPISIGGLSYGFTFGASETRFRGTVTNVQLGQGEAASVATKKDECKKGGWADLTRADGTSFKNQGDCIQYVNTGK